MPNPARYPCTCSISARLDRADVVSNATKRSTIAKLASAMSLLSLASHRETAPRSWRSRRLDCFVVEPVLGPAYGRTRGLLATTKVRYTFDSRSAPDWPTIAR